MVNTLLLSYLRQAITQIESLHSPCVLIAHKAIPFLGSGKSHFLNCEKKRFGPVLVRGK